jgi:hypothetical protein
VVISVAGSTAAAEQSTNSVQTALRVKSFELDMCLMLDLVKGWPRHPNGGSRPEGMVLVQISQLEPRATVTIATCLQRGKIPGLVLVIPI